MRRLGALGAGVALLASASCGTRLPDSAFSSEGGPAVPAGSASSAGANPPASIGDPGVTATSIKVGMIDSVGSLLGPDTFSGPMYGAQAFFKALNASGGVNGRQIVVVPCDDHGFGGSDVTCAHKLIDEDKVFAFAGNSA